MDVTERHRQGPVVALTALLVVGALVVGAVGESLLAPRLADAAANVRSQVENIVDTLSHQVSPKAAPAPSAVATAPASPAGTAQSAPTATAAAAPLSTDEPYVAVVRKAGPAVVTVVNQMPPQFTPFGQIAQPEALGSGVIIDQEGHIVTNNHVVAGGDKFQVIFSDARKVPAQLVGRDSISDIAVLKVDGPVPAVASFGDSSKLEPGQQVVAIGSALGNFRNTVTHGIISGLDRTLSDPGEPGLSGLIQTDAPINHGNSGGPLLNLRGEVIGINTAVVRVAGLTGDVAEGLGFAVPSNTAKEISQQLIANGSVPRPFLGVNYDVLSPQIASYYGLGATQGALIRSVSPGSPAARAGIKPGDVITAIDGTPIDEEHSLASVLLAHKVGDTIRITLTRDHQTLNLTATLAQRPTEAQ